MARKNPFWPADKVVALRHRITVTRDGEAFPANQTEFGAKLGGYIQATISRWETNGCKSRRGCHDLQRLADTLKPPFAYDG